MVRNSRRYRTWSVCEGLLEASWAARFEDPQRCADLAVVALALASLLPKGVYGDSLLQGLKARCWADLANGLRILSDYKGAEDAFRQSSELLADRIGFPSETARYLDHRASYLNAQRKFDEADQSVTQAIRLYRDVGDRHALGIALVKKGMIVGNRGDSDRQVVLVRQGIELISPELEPQVVVVGWQNIIMALHRSGRDREALLALGKARPLYLERADRTTLLRFQWLEGMVARSLGRPEQAEGCLAEARDGFIRLGIAHDAALVSLELAALLADQGRNLEVCRLATEMITIFESRECRQETLAALILLRQAAERGRVTEKLVQRLLSSVQKAGA